MIRPDEVTPIGRITRQRGLRGEVELAFTDDCFDRADAPYIVLEDSGILIPYFWEEYRFKNDTTAVFKFFDTDTDEAAKRLVGRAAYYPLEYLSAEERNTLRSLQGLVGYTARDAAGGVLGAVEGVDESTQNVLLYLRRPDGEEAIVPFHTDFLVALDPEARSLTLQLPVGLLGDED